MSTILTENHEPAIAYSDIYTRAVVHFSTSHIFVERGNEIPFVKEIQAHSDSLTEVLHIEGLVNDIPLETMLARQLSSLFCTDSVAIFPAAETWGFDPMYENYVVVVGNGRFETYPVASCKIVLERKFPKQQNH